MITGATTNQHKALLLHCFSQCGCIFDDLFDEFTTEHKLTNVKTTNMGSLFKLTYNLTLKDAGSEKAFIDKLRCRNGNLEISSSLQETKMGEL